MTADFTPTDTRARIDDEERRLIAAAVAEGRVQKIPTGKSAFAEEYVWSGCEDGPGIGRLDLKEPMTRQEALAKFKARNMRPRQFKADPALQARRAKVLELTNEGLSGPAIAKRLGVDPKTVKNDRKHLQKKGKLEKLSSGANGKTKADIEARREKVLSLILAGKSNPQVAAELNISLGKVIGDRLVLRESGKLKKVVNGGQV